jgi:hypothetical protein
MARMGATSGEEAMTTLANELEQFRQQMLEDVRENEVELVRMAAELEKAELGLIAQLRSVIEAHEQRREMFMAELRAFSGRLARTNPNQISPPLNHRNRDWTTQSSSRKNPDLSDKQFAN